MALGGQLQIVSMQADSTLRHVRKECYRMSRNEPEGTNARIFKPKVRKQDYKHYLKIALN
jgi:hypothetical protein